MDVCGIPEIGCVWGLKSNGIKTEFSRIQDEETKAKDNVSAGMKSSAFCDFTSRATLPLLYDCYPRSRHSFTFTETKLHMLLRAFDFPSLLTQEHGHVTHFVFLSARASLILAMPHVTLSSQILAIILVKLEGTNLTHIAFCLCRC